MKIAVYAISKNEAQFVERFCESAKDADIILIADTGSTDDTIQKALEWDMARGKGFPGPEGGGATLHINTIHVSPWRFDIARNAALSLLPADIDVCVSLDLDEELQPGWREEIERAWTAGTTRLRYGFDWGAGIVFQYEKIHARKGYRWAHPVHEYPVPDRIEEVWANTDKLLVIHKPDPTKSRGQYLDLLKMSVEEDPQDPRNGFYLAREYSFHGLWQESIDACKAYLALPKAVWPNERCYAMRVMSRCFAELGRHDEAANWARRAVAEAPYTREPWCEVAMLAYRASRWAECYGAARSALAITNREMVYTVDPAVWGMQPHDLASISAWWLGLKDEAVRHCQDALAHEPDNERLRANLAMMLGSDSMAAQ